MLGTTNGTIKMEFQRRTLRALQLQSKNKNLETQPKYR
jgi:hypothetical protein